ncbi:MAG TPA: electron transfer flavoprotein subunit alpha/FixB family protein [Thermoplasmata archaeon]|jgi:electron transfer flavoprotein alpha subunit|nr:electron transfer flavoprotein subunit alpha/FixB family protein [Thermoplasmata archaeon]
MTAANVLAVAEHREGKIAGTTYELVAKGRDLAAKTGGRFTVALLGKDVAPLASEVASRGAEVFLVEHDALAAYTPGGYAEGLAAILGRAAPRVVLFAHTAQGFDLAPRLAAEWNAPIVSNCVDLGMDGDALIAFRRILNDKMSVELAVTSDRPILATLRPGSVKPAAAGGVPGAVTPVPVSIDPAKTGRTFLGYEKPQVQDIDIATADVVVSAGRGIQKKENLVLIDQLAKALGGVVGASRPLTDMEWLPKTRQVGQSGKTVRPKLYIACGISGAMQHIAGMKDAGLILAINTDPSAPIFEVAHYGVVANVLEFVPALIKELRGG